MRLLLIALVTTTSLQAQTPYGYDWLNSPVSPGVIKRSAAAQPSAPSSKAANPLRLSVGYAVRSFEADFKMSAPSIGLISPYLGGFGDVGAFGPHSNRVDYEDGAIFLNSGDGTAFVRVYGDWTTSDGVAVVDPGELILDSTTGYEWRSTQTLHSKAFEMLTHDGSAIDRGWAGGPYVCLSQTLVEEDFGSLGFSITWTNLHGLLDATAHMGHPTRVDFNYTYDVADFSSYGTDFVSAYGVVVDANAVNALHQLAFGTPGNFRNSRRTTTQYAVPSWSAFGTSFLDVRLNEIFLSSDITWKAWHGWEFGLSAGPTLNVVSTTLNQRAFWQREDGLTVFGGHSSRSETAFALGAGIEARMQHDLTGDGRVFVESHAAYKWLNELSLTGPSSSANLDLSGWEIGLGVGIRLDDWPAGAPWSIRIGADARKLSLSTGATDIASLKSLFNLHHRAAGFFNGHDPVRYDDGYIYGIEGFGSGVISVIGPGNFDRFRADSEDQLHRTGHHNPFPGAPFYDGSVDFHSRDYRQTIQSVRSRSAERDEWGLNPAFELSKVLLVGGPLSIGVTWGWAALNSELWQGPTITSDLTARRVGDLVTYRYPYLAFFVEGLTFNNDGSVSGSGLLANPSYSHDGGGNPPPVQSRTPFSDTMHYFALSSASVDVSMQTLSFATDLSWKPLKHLEVGVSAGPTVNVVSTSTDLTTDWIREDGLLFARLQDHETQTQLRFGWRILASARYDLDRDGRWFAETRGGYEWMQNIDLGIGLQAASLDASSWQVGAGLGCRLGVKPKMAEIRQLSSRQSRVKSEPESQNWRDRLLWRTRSAPANE